MEFYRILQSMIKLKGPMETIEIKIKKINCSGCAGRIYRALSQFDGIVKSSVDRKNSNVSVKYDERKISVDKIKETINIAGLEVFENV